MFENDPPIKQYKFTKRHRELRHLLGISSSYLSRFVALQQRLKSKPAKQAAGRIVQQFGLVNNMIFMPCLLVIDMQARVEGVRLVWQERLTQQKMAWPDRKGIKEIEKEAMNRLFALDKKRNGHLIRPWLYSTAVYIWTAFESSASDLWIEALNHGTDLAQKVLASIPKEDTDNVGLSRRQIDVGLAARYGFDLRKCLGTVLGQKFDFTKFIGIKTAYERAFGTCGQDFETVGNTLKELEQVRHIIVHRGGIADDKFLKLTKLRVARGRTVRLSLSQVSNYALASVIGTAILLEIVDSWFTKPTSVN